METPFAAELTNATDEQIRAIVAEYFAAMKQLNEQSAREQAEIEQLQSETRAILARFPQGALNVETIFGVRPPTLFGD